MGIKWLLCIQTLSNLTQYHNPPQLINSFLLIFLLVWMPEKMCIHQDPRDHSSYLIYQKLTSQFIYLSTYHWISPLPSLKLEVFYHPFLLQLASLLFQIFLEQWEFISSYQCHYRNHLLWVGLEYAFDLIEIIEICLIHSCPSQLDVCFHQTINQII